MVEYAHETRQETATGWGVRALISAGFAGFLALMAIISFPVPWTPVPFSMMPLGLLVAGAFQRPQWAALSVAIYLLAAGLGAPIFADGESGWKWFIGSSGGYLFGFLLVSPLVSWYMAERREGLTPRWIAILLGLFGVGATAGIAAIAWFLGTESGISTVDSDVSGWNHGRSALWVLLFLIAGMTGLTVALLKRGRGETNQALNLFLVMLGSIILLHICGVTVLWLVTDLSLIHSIILGSIVFLPFDVLKSGLAVAATLPLLPVKHD